MPDTTAPQPLTAEALIGLRAAVASPHVDVPNRHTLAGLLATVDALRAALADAVDAFEECTGDYAKELAEPDLAKWRALLAPGVSA